MFIDDATVLQNYPKGTDLCLKGSSKLQKKCTTYGHIEARGVRILNQSAKRFPIFWKAFDQI